MRPAGNKASISHGTPLIWPASNAMWPSSTRSKNSVYAYAYQGERARSVPLPRDDGDYPQQRNLHGEHFDISVQSHSALNVGN